VELRRGQHVGCLARLEARHLRVASLLTPAPGKGGRKATRPVGGRNHAGCCKVVVAARYMARGSQCDSSVTGAAGSRFKIIWARGKSRGSGAQDAYTSRRRMAVLRGGRPGAVGTRCSSWLRTIASFAVARCRLLTPLPTFWWSRVLTAHGPINRPRSPGHTKNLPIVLWAWPSRNTETCTWVSSGIRPSALRKFFSFIHSCAHHNIVIV
jgi:hypothetical protein